MITMPDVDFARTLFITANHLIHTSSVFIWTGNSFAIELNRHEFLAEIAREFGLVQEVNMKTPTVFG